LAEDLLSETTIIESPSKFRVYLNCLIKVLDGFEVLAKLGL
jgi:hypothetical protein